MLNVKDVFELGVKLGSSADPRGLSGVKKYLAKIKKEYDDSKPSDREYFDKNSLTNPYVDSGIHIDDGKTNVKRVLAGIDIGAGDILLASQLNERGKKIDLVIAHHPIGKTLADLPKVMDMFVDMYESYGVPVHLAEKIMEERIREVGRSVHPINHFQLIDIAKHLQVNLINTHTITDNLVNEFLRDYIKKKGPETVAELLKILLEIPEYQEAKRRGAGPKIFAGSPNHRVGKFMLEMTGGTNPSNKIYSDLSSAGISTIVGMHMTEPANDKAIEHRLNVVIAGHISSDSLGMNLFLDELEKKGVEIVPCGGLIRISRAKKNKK